MLPNMDFFVAELCLEKCVIYMASRRDLLKPQDFLAQLIIC